MAAEAKKEGAKNIDDELGNVADIILAKEKPKSRQNARVIGEVKMVDVDGKAGLILTADKLELPLDEVEVREELNVLHVSGKNGRKIRVGIGSGLDGLSLAEENNAAAESTPARKEDVKLVLPDSEDREKKPKRSELEDYVKLDAGLVDLRKEFLREIEGDEGEEFEEGGEVDEEELGTLEKIMLKVLHRGEKDAVSVDLDKELKKLSLQNLAKVGQMDDKRAAIVGVGYVLKEFLQIKFRIPHELTYGELVSEIEDAKMKDDLKRPLTRFFSKLSNASYASDDYARGLSEDHFPGIYDMAKHVINELG